MLAETVPPHDLQMAVEAELQTDEKIVWAAQPIPRRFSRKALPIMLFGIPWTAFAFFWTALAASGIARAEAPVFAYVFPLFGLPFILVGLGMLSAPYWHYRKARRTVYLITNHRAIIFDAGHWGPISVRSFAPKRLSNIRRHQYPDGSGDLIFDHTPHKWNDGDEHSAYVGFWAIPNVREAETLISSLTQKSED
jgi:hypothetical protein